MQKSKKDAATSSKSLIDKETQEQMPLLANNFLLMAISLIMIILGFALMGGSSSGLDSFNWDIFSFRRIVAGPTISFLGFVLMAIAIIVKPKDAKK